MKKFAETTLLLDKNVKKGDKESLLSLFSVRDRFKRMEILNKADENTPVKVVLGDLGQTELKIGDDIAQGMQRTVMTLFWFEERSKLMEMQRDASKGEVIPLNLLF